MDDRAWSVREPTPLDDVDFLARSDHRVTVLRRLASGPTTRSALHDATAISQPTLGRILGAFADRHWVERDGHEYGLTATGTLLAAAFEDLLGTVGTVQRVGDVLAGLPTEEMDFDLRAFATARVTRPEPGDVFAPVDRLATAFYGAGEGRIVADTIPPGTPEDHRNRADRFAAGEQRREGINSRESMERLLADEAAAALVRDALVATDRIDVYEYDGPIPCVLALADDLALLAPTDVDGVPTALVETADPTVREWVEARLDEYRANATLVTPERFDSRTGTD